MAVTNAYATVDELREHFGDASDKLGEAMLERALDATSRAIDRWCGWPLRRFWQDPAPTARTYRADDPYDLVVTDISTAVGLTIATDDNGDGTYETTWSASDYQLEPLSAIADGEPATRIVAVGARTWPVAGRRAGVQVTARHGWAAIPTDVRAATLIRAAAIFKRKEAIFGSAAMNGFGEISIGRRDPDVIALLHPLVRITVRAA